MYIYIYICMYVYMYMYIEGIYSIYIQVYLSFQVFILKTLLLQIKDLLVYLQAYLVSAGIIQNCFVRDRRIGNSNYCMQSIQYLVSYFSFTIYNGQRLFLMTYIYVTTVFKILFEVFTCLRIQMGLKAYQLTFKNYNALKKSSCRIQLIQYQKAHQLKLIRVKEKLNI